MTDELNDISETEIEQLLSKFGESRTKLESYMDQVDVIREQVAGIFPVGQDFRNKFALEEKMKAMSSFFSTLLSIRQEYNKTIKDEIEIRRKLTPAGGSGDDDVGSIRDIAGGIEDELYNDDMD